MIEEYICKETNKPSNEPKVVTCRCSECWKYLCDLEDAAICPHGFLAGCPNCGESNEEEV